MIILMDTREQRGLRFSHPYITKVERVALAVGDYGCKFKDNHSPAVLFERKSVADLFGSLGKGHRRFKNELLRAKEKNIRLYIIIEGTFSRVLRGHKHSTIAGLTIIRQLMTIWARYNIEPIFCKDRDEMTQQIIERYIAIGKEYIKNKRRK